jgi:hypothetical protein
MDPDPGGPKTDGSGSATLVSYCSFRRQRISINLLVTYSGYRLEADLPPSSPSSQRHGPFLPIGGSTALYMKVFFLTQLIVKIFVEMSCTVALPFKVCLFLCLSVSLL